MCRHCGIGPCTVATFAAGAVEIPTTSLRFVSLQRIEGDPTPRVVRGVGRAQLYFFASAASFSRYFFCISSCSCRGTMA
jgi:hypothetical protein